MFERFTDRVRRVLVLSQESARRLRHDVIGTEHLLAGLVGEGEGIAAQALASFGITLADVERKIVEHRIPARVLGRNNEPPFTPRAKLALERSLREALKLGHNYIGTEHILLGLLANAEFTAARVLLDLGVDERNGRSRVIELMAKQSPSPRIPTARVITLPPQEAAQTVAAFEGPMAKLTDLAHDGMLDAWDEEYVSNIVQSVHLWRQRTPANPQYFEMLMADLVTHLLDRLTNVATLRRELIGLGAAEDLADEISERIRASIADMQKLGDKDPHKDAAVLERIAESADRTADAVEQLNLKGDKSLTRKAGEAAALGAAGFAGKQAAVPALHLVRTALEDNWAQIQVGLVLAWRTVKEWFLQ